MFSVDSSLGENGEGDALVGDKPLNFLVGFGFLTSELVRGECKDLEALILVFGVKGNKLLVVSIGQTSVTRYVHDHAYFARERREWHYRPVCARSVEFEE